MNEDPDRGNPTRRSRDAAADRLIYAPYVVDKAVSFEERPPSDEAMARAATRPETGGGP